MKTLLFSATILLCLMVNPILCQEEEDSGGSFMSRFKSMMKKLWNDMKNIFNEFKQEVKARTTDMRDWSREMFEDFKQKMKEWIDQASEASNSEKEEMRRELERIEMESA